jgi:hypothetical protein
LDEAAFHRRSLICSMMLALPESSARPLAARRPVCSQVDRRSVVNPRQARALLEAVRAQQPSSVREMR